MNNDRFQNFQHALSPCSMCLIIHSPIEILLIVIKSRQNKRHEQERKNGIQSTLIKIYKYTNKQINTTSDYKKIN